MALFGFHIIVSLISIAVYKQVRARFSFAGYFVYNGLFYYAPPPIEELREISGKKLNKQKRRRDSDDGVFNVPKDADFPLLKCELNTEVLKVLPYFTTLTWIVDFSVFSFLVYTISEIFTFFFPENKDFNISLWWLVVLGIFVLQALTQINISKITSPELHAERNLILCFSAISFLLCTIFAMSCDKYMDIKFTEGYKNLTKWVNDYLETQQGFYKFADLQEKSPLLMYISLAGFFAFVSAMLLFPNFRYVVSFLKAVAIGSPQVKTGLHTVFIIPIIILALFSNPVKDHVLSNARFSWLSESQFEFIRILLIVLWALLRISTAKIHLQSYLDLPIEKIQTLRRETGYVKSNELQKMIYQYASYFCAAALQYFLPVLLTLVTALLLKSVGNISPFERTPSIPTNSTEPTIHAFLSLDAQKPMWTFFLVLILIINCSLSMLGVVYYYNFNAI